MIIFLTFNDKPSGIFTSQVIDVVKVLAAHEKVLLVSFISWRIFKISRNKIKAQYANSLVIPILFGLKRWKWNIPIFRLLAKFYKATVCIARNSLACQIAMATNIKNVCYDGRAAVKAEIEEFGVIEHPQLAREAIEAERNAVLNTNFRISVSHELIRYWRATFDYQKNEHTIIPCTLSHHFSTDIDINKIEKLKRELGIEQDDIVGCFSGGTGGWNSLERTFQTFAPILEKNKHVKLILLTQNRPYIEEFIRRFPLQVFRFWVAHDEVKEYLSMGDYGLLIREDKITNNVASPVKFAEYLSLGLNIIISDNIRDYAKFVEEHQCGQVVDSSSGLILQKTSASQKVKNRRIAQESLSKSSPRIQRLYLDLLERLTTEEPNSTLSD